MSLSTFHVSSDTDVEHAGAEYNVAFEMEVSWAAGYEGQDADGNRGVWMEGEDSRDWKITRVRRYDENLDLTEELDINNLDPALKAAIDAHLEEYEVEPPEEEDYEPDYDPTEEEEKRDRRMDGPDYD